MNELEKLTTAETINNECLLTNDELQVTNNPINSPSLFWAGK